ncbi:hypothetical protein [Nonomuraea sp. NPDC003804]|uniref:hypothetical protein n=1 Tax=Nonomuraea sp. NPDC003804 TaxID=3154547 RepID=UPI0033BEAB74
MRSTRAVLRTIVTMAAVGLLGLAVAPAAHAAPKDPEHCTLVSCHDLAEAIDNEIRAWLRPYLPLLPPDKPGRTSVQASWSWSDARADATP